jgi:hypothetical protein
MLGRLKKHKIKYMKTVTSNLELVEKVKVLFCNLDVDFQRLLKNKSYFCHSI